MFLPLCTEITLWHCDALAYTSHTVYTDDMETKRGDFNLYITVDQFNLISRLKKTGINMSSLCRLAIRKCSHMPLDPEDESPCLKRVAIYLASEDAVVLQRLSDQLDEPRSQVLRRLLTTYLRINTAAIESLF